MRPTGRFTALDFSRTSGMKGGSVQKRHPSGPFLKNVTSLLHSIGTRYFGLLHGGPWTSVTSVRCNGRPLTSHEETPMWLERGTVVGWPKHRLRLSFPTPPKPEVRLVKQQPWDQEHWGNEGVVLPEHLGHRPPRACMEWGGM